MKIKIFMVKFYEIRGKYTMKDETIKPNEKQQEAIDIQKGPVMLLAGPGTGKTYTVINRIEKMLSDGIEPSSILCLTFSDAAANEMRQRLIKQMGVIASSVDVYTYHSFCNDIIKNYPSQFNLSANVRVINDTEKITLMKECIDEANLQYFVAPRADRYHFTNDFINHIEKIKSKRISKDDYLAYIETNPKLRPRLNELEAEVYEREQRGETRNKGRYDEIEKIKNNIEKAKELWELFEAYSCKMLNHNLIDFADMINLVLDEFGKDSSFLSDVSNKYAYFLVDEYQDTNHLQNEIIFNLVDANKENNIFVVGDDDQIIYGFQGARIDNIENFLKKYPDTQVICLRENNRSTQSILDFSYAVITQDDNRLENLSEFKNKNISKKLTAKNKKIIPLDKKVRLLHFGETMQETNHIVDEIKALVESDKCPKNDDGENDLSKIAIIAKKRAELKMFAELLKGKNIPIQIDEGRSIFSIRSSILIYFYIKAMVNNIYADDKLFGLLLAEPFKINLEDYNKILREKNLFKKEAPSDFISLMRKLDGWKDNEKIKNFLKTYDELKEYAASNSLRSTILEIINRTGILVAFHNEPKNKIENLMGIKKFIEEATEFANLNITASLVDFVKYLDECLVNEIDITTDKSSIIQNAIQLTTYHGSKGREFDCVYLPNLISRNWENFSMPGEYKLITDEVLEKEEEKAKKDRELLKLLFVGITRAKHTLTLSFADMDDGKANQITKYLADFTEYDFDRQTFEYNAEDFAYEFLRSISRDVYDNKQAFIDEIRERVKNTVLSPSRMNDYLDCPRKFYYTKILGIDIEEGNWDYANFGTLMHSLLENAVKMAKNKGTYPDLETVMKDFETNLDKTRFTTEAKKEQFAKLGKKALESYYPSFSQLPASSIEDIELSFYGVNVGDDIITGKIDRIEKNNDGTYSLYDYKTGTPVSEKEIAVGGKKEGYYNQLCFYKYAYEKLTGKKVSQVGILYIEKHEKSVYKTFDNSDMEYIEKLIKDTYKNIKELKFDPVPEDTEGVCKNCAYKQLCRLDVI